MNRLLIIQPTFYTDRDRTALFKSRARPLVGLTLPYLAALTPAGWDVTLVDEQVQDIDFEAPADVVAITTWTINADRAFEISRRFRERGVPVLMGGPHTYFNREEVARQCDAVGIGEAENIWGPMLEDVAAGRLKPVYTADHLHDLAGLPTPRFELVNGRRARWWHTYSVQTSRGCPFKCEFCSERFFVGERYRQRPPEDVVEELKAIGARNVFFADSMFAGKKERTMELMERLIPLRIRWSTLWTTYLCLDDEFMDLAKRSGVLHVNMGMESIDARTLASVNKRFNKVDQYEAILSGLRRRGISYSLNFVLGFDEEQPDVDKETIRFLEKHRVPVAYFYMLEPKKGTAFFDRMDQEGRVIYDPSNPRYHNKYRLTPKQGTLEDLERKVHGMHGQFYSLGSMVRRLPPPTSKANLASWVLNFSQRRLRRSEHRFENHDWT